MAEAESPQEAPQGVIETVAVAAPAPAPAAPASLEPAAPTAESVSTLFDQAYAKVKELVRAKEFNAGNWFSLVPLVMEIVEEARDLHGAQKKALAVDLLAKLVCEIPMSDADRALVKTVISTALPLMIDTIVASSLGELAINVIDDIEEKASLCFMRCKAKKK